MPQPLWPAELLHGTLVGRRSIAVVELGVEFGVEVTVQLANRAVLRGLAENDGTPVLRLLAGPRGGDLLLTNAFAGGATVAGRHRVRGLAARRDGGTGNLRTSL